MSDHDAEAQNNNNMTGRVIVTDLLNRCLEWAEIVLARCVGFVKSSSRTPLTVGVGRARLMRDSY